MSNSVTKEEMLAYFWTAWDEYTKDRGPDYRGEVYDAIRSLIEDHGDGPKISLANAEKVYWDIRSGKLKNLEYYDWLCSIGVVVEE